MANMSEENIKKQLQTQKENLKKYVTIVKHLSGCEKSCDFLEEMFRKTKGDIKLTWNEFNFSEFRLLDDESVLIVYVEQFLLFLFVFN